MTSPRDYASNEPTDEGMLSRNHYIDKYDDIDRFISYFYQISTVADLKPSSILEVGVGNKTVSNYIKNSGFHIITCDVNEKLNPDFVGDIRELPIKGSMFDCVLSCEVLEHIPFEDFSLTLSELNRVSMRYVIISIPYNCFFLAFGLHMKLPYFNWMKHFNLKIPLFIKRFYMKEGHHWEMGYRNFPKKKVDAQIQKIFTIEREFEPPMNPYHHFYILKKKNQ